MTETYRPGEMFHLRCQQRALWSDVVASAAAVVVVLKIEVFGLWLFYR